MQKKVLIRFSWLCLVFLLGVLQVQGQEVRRMEYFFNQDPGFGQGTAVLFSPGTDVTVTFQADVAALPPGFHQLYLRSANAAGLWSMTARRTFYKVHAEAVTAAGQVPDITKGEFFFDLDPGLGKGRPIAITPGQHLEQVNFAADITDLGPGFHHLYLRFKNSAGQWSMPTKRTFYKQDLAAVAAEGQLPDIVQGEYFFNADPGFGRAADIALHPGQDLQSLSFNADITALPPGFHQLYLRFRNARGQWGMTSKRTFYKESLAAIVPEGQAPNITKGEFFFDSDPGFGRATGISFVPGQELQDLGFTADITNLSPGFHHLYLRFKNADGRWSMTSKRTFFKEELPEPIAGQPASIVKGEYFIDADPGYGQGTDIPLTPAPDLSSLAFALDMSQVSVGNHKLFVRFRDAAGRWSSPSVNDFKVEAPTERFVNTGTLSGPLCVNAAVAVPFTVNAPFGSNNIFTAELSDASGNFANPLAIGTLSGTASGTINAFIPAHVAAGSNYRIRVSASSPTKVSEANSTALVIGRGPENLAISGAAATCAGVQTYTAPLSGTGELTYTWELAGGGTLQANGNTATVTWTSAGTHTLKLTLANSCGSAASTLAVTVDETAPAVAPAIVANGRWLTASALPAGAAGYQWFYNGAAVAGATGASHYAGGMGEYAVKFKNNCGAGPLSNVLLLRQEQTITFLALPNKTLGDAPFSLSGHASSGLPLSFEVVSGPATLSGQQVSLTGAGTVVIRASQPGDSAYEPAQQVDRAFQVNKATQTLTFEDFPAKTFGDAPFEVQARASSGLPLQYSILSGPATLTGSLLTITGAGEVTLQASQAGSADYLAATASKQFTVQPAPATITLEELSQVYNGFGRLPSAVTVPADLPVSFSFEGGSTMPIAAGSYALTAAINSPNYRGSATATFTITRAPQSISLEAVADKAWNEPAFALTALASSGLPVSLQLETVPAGIASLNGHTVTLLGQGQVTIVASQPGNENFEAAASVSESFLVGKASQSISFAALADKTIGEGPVMLAATASSGLPVSLVLVSGPAALNGAELTLTGTGTVVVQAIQEGNGEYSPAATVERRFTVRKPSQHITFAPLAGKVFGDAPFPLAAVSSSGLPVYFRVRSGPAVLTGNTLSLVGAGTVVVEALQAGDETYAAAVPVSQSIVVGKASQTISFAALADQVFARTPLTLSAAASSQLPVQYEVVAGHATVAGSLLSLTGLGTVRVRAVQAGGENYAPVSQEQSFCVSAAPSPIQGFTKSCLSQQRYQVASLPGASHSWSLSGGGTLSATSGEEVTVTWTGLGRHTLSVSTAGSCDAVAAVATTSVEVSDLAAPGQVANMLPAQDTPFSFAPIAFSWQPVENASRYDLFIWEEGQPEPAMPTAANLDQIGYVFQDKEALTPGARYLWKVVARNACRQTPSGVQAFVMRHLSNLRPRQVVAPATVFSGQQLSLSWEVQNSGLGTTGNTAWSDAVYLSPDSVLNTLIDHYLGGVPNVSALGAGQSYGQSATFALPTDMIGKFYLIVQANSYGQVKEAEVTDNVSLKPIQINLTPPADLRVSSVIAPGSAFSGQAASLTYTVHNKGAGSTNGEKWVDRVYLSAEPELDTTQAVLIGDYAYNRTGKGPLKPDSSYTQQVHVFPPGRIYGQHYLFVVTNATREVYEFTFTNNNTGRSDSIQVFLTPPPDFAVTQLQIPDQLTRGNQVEVNWTVENIGASKPFAGRDFPKDTLWIRYAGQSGAMISNEYKDFLETRPKKIGVWADALFLSKEQTFDPRTATRLGEEFIMPPLNENCVVIAMVREGYMSCRPCGEGCMACGWIPPEYWYEKTCEYPVMNPEDLYRSSQRLTVPELPSGVYYLYLVTDIGDNVFEFDQEANNVYRKVVELVHPDLVPGQVSFPNPNAYSGKPVELQWTVKNEGLGDPVHKMRKDLIFLSPSPDFNLAGAIRLDSLVYNTRISPGGSVQKQKTVTLPNGLAGTYYFHVITDADNGVYEQDREDNNQAVSAALPISLSASADLQASNVRIDADMIMSDVQVPVRFTVTNSGQEEVLGATWTDHIYLSKVPVWDSTQAQLLKAIPRTQTLAPGATYEVVDSLFLPMSKLRDWKIDMMDCYLFVLTDAGRKVYEHLGENNNLARSAPVQVMHQPHADLAVTSVSGPEAAFSGKPASVQWAAKNLGGETGYYYAFWYDGIYLSRDTIRDPDDLFVTDKVIYGPLSKNQSYTSKLDFTVPHGLSGDYYLLLVADHTDVNRDRKQDNNYKVIRDVQGQPLPLTITLSPSPDLAVTALRAPPQAVSGQPIRLHHEVSNQGNGATPPSWTEKVYLSTDNKVDDADMLVGSYARSGVLAPGASYRDSLEVYIPIEAVGNYYLLFFTDNNNGVYEHEAESNNVRAAILAVTQAPPSDLVVTEVSPPAQAVAGDSLVISWTLKNTGHNPALGRKKDGLYFSRDGEWDEGDILVAQVPASLNLAPQASIRHSARIRLKGLALGDYQVLVRADMGNNILENREDNNITSSITSLSVQVRELPLQVPTLAQLPNQDELYYRLEVGDDLVGETLLLTLKGDSVAGANELYARFGEMATRASHDFAYGQALYGNQEIVLSAVKKGTYYLLVTGATSAPGKQQQLRLLASKINFEVRAIAAKEGGNTGSVTVKINGAKFEQHMQVALTDATLGTIVAHYVKVISPTALYASFNLAGAGLGLYDVRLTKAGNETASLADGFTVAAGLGGGVAGGGSGGGGGFYCSLKNEGVEEMLALDIQYPLTTRTRRVFPMTINFGNAGNVDLATPTRMLLSLGGAPIALDPAEIGLNKTELILEFRETDGPDNVLRPGASGSITIYTQASSQLRFKLIE
ncbi:MAG: CARDB domain-containing protein [Adhaeribacter sp.]